MSVSGPISHYALGSTDAEHERLIWQAERFAPLTERLFREAGIGPGQRVLDIGSGVGDVALLAARLVGSSGEVVGIERDARSIARAQARVTDAGLHNVSFVQCDLSQIPDSKSFDAAVGRFILMWLPDPVSVLRSVSRLVRLGGVLAFQEPYWAPLLSLLAPLPLWSAAASLIYKTFQLSGANPELGPALYQAFQEAGLPGPAMRLEMPLGKGPEFAQWFYDILCTLRPQILKFNLPIGPLGDIDTLVERLQVEGKFSDSVVSFPPPVGAWARKPAD
jgi:ubiquinone/menaquinone biosynthesis C-methylase UbiE